MIEILETKDQQFVGTLRIEKNYAALSSPTPSFSPPTSSSTRAGSAEARAATKGRGAHHQLAR